MAQDLHRNLDPLRIANNPSISHINPSTPRSHPRSQHASELKPNLMLHHDHLHLGVANKQQETMDEGKQPKVESIFLDSNSSEAQSMISPFLTEHIPQQYNPFGSGEQPPPAAPSGKPSTSYCYRHNPDSKCRRTANEPTMEELQSELGKLSQSDQQGISTVWSLFSAAPSKHRNLMLQGILAQCCFPQLSFISSSVRDLIKIDFISALPVELGTKILCYLDTASLCRAAQVSQRWRILADDDRVWRKMCEQHIGCKCTRCGWGLPVLEQQRLRMEKRQMQMRANHRGINEWSPQITPLALPENTSTTSPNATPTTLSIGDKRSSPHDSAYEDNAKRVCKTSVKEDSQDSVGYFDTRRKRPWKDVYKDRFRVGSNWKSGRCSLKFFRGHTNGIMCLQFDNNILATGSYDNTAKIWDIETGKELRTLSGHTAGIRCLQFDESRLFTGSIDATLKVWNWRTGECVRTFRGHTRGIICLHFSDKILASGSMDNTIKIWNLADKQTFSLRGHTDWVNSVKIDSASRTLFSASDDCTVRLWDLETRTCIRIFRGHVGQVQQVLPLGPEFELEDEDTHDDLPDLSDDAEKPNALPYFNYSRRPGDSEPESQPKARPPKYMLTGSLDSTIRLWHVPSGRCVRTFFGHLEGIWALAADSLRMVSGAEDRMVKIWDPRTGEHERTFTGHAGPVTCVGLSDDRLATGSEDCEVRLYSFEADHELQVGAEEEEGRVACRGTPG